MEQKGLKLELRESADAASLRDSSPRRDLTSDPSAADFVELFRDLLGVSGAELTRVDLGDMSYTEPTVAKPPKENSGRELAGMELEICEVDELEGEVELPEDDCAEEREEDCGNEAQKGCRDDSPQESVREELVSEGAPLAATTAAVTSEESNDSNEEGLKPQAESSASSDFSSTSRQLLKTPKDEASEAEFRELKNAALAAGERPASSEVPAASEALKGSKESEGLEQPKPGLKSESVADERRAQEAKSGGFAGDNLGSDGDGGSARGDESALPERRSGRRDRAGALPSSAPNGFSAEMQTSANPLVADTAIANSTFSSPASGSKSGEIVSFASLLADRSGAKKAAEVAEKSKTLMSRNAENTERIMKMLKDAARLRSGNQMSVRMDPPELGEIHLKLTHRAGEVFAKLTPESAELGEMLKTRMPEILKSLSSAGISLDNFHISISGNSSAEVPLLSGAFSGEKGAGDPQMEGDKRQAKSKSGNSSGNGDSTASHERGAGAANADAWVA